MAEVIETVALIVIAACAMLWAALMTLEARKWRATANRLEKMFWEANTERLSLRAHIAIANIRLTQARNAKGQFTRADAG